MGGLRNDRHTVWTWLTGSLTLASWYLAALSGVFLPLHGSLLRLERVALAGLTAVSALLWMAVSALTARQPATESGRPPATPLGTRRTKVLSLLLGSGAVLLSAAALSQATGPGGEAGRWLTQVYDAGGGTYSVEIDHVLSAPLPNGIGAHHGGEEYTATLAVIVPFDSGPRSVVVHDATTADKPVPGGHVDLVFAPSRPDLGVRNEPSPWPGVLHSLIVLCALGAGASAGRGAMRTPELAHHLRRFRADIHVPAALVLALGGSLILPVVLGCTGTALSWLLALASATTPWFAFSRAVRRIEQPNGGRSGASP